MKRLGEKQPPTRRTLQTLRDEVGTARAALTTSQLELRQKAHDKFRRADQMLFTRRGLEQSTDEGIALFKRSLIGEGHAIADLCCGIGGDLLALGQGNRIVGVDQDEGIGHLAHHNAQVYGQKEVSIRCDDVRRLDPEPYDILHLDPDRRPNEKRHSQSWNTEPPWSWIEGLIKDETALILKLAPAATLPAQASSRSLRQWIESRGECRQQIAWFDSLTDRPGAHEAVSVSPEGTPLWSLRGTPEIAVKYAGSPLRYLIEPARPVLAAHLSGSLAQTHDLQGLWPSIGYLTADHPAPTLAATSFEIEEFLPYDRKRIRSWLRQRKIGRVEVKKRGTQLDPGQVRKELAGSGENAITLVLAGREKKVTAILCRRIPGHKEST